MQIVNFDPVNVNAGDTILTVDQAKAGGTEGMEYVCINPSVAIVLVSAQGAHPNIPGSVAGTAANSPFTCAANTPTMVAHRGGEIKGITTGGASTVKFALAEGP